MTTFEEQVLPLRETLYGEAMRLTHNPTEAEDLVMEIRDEKTPMVIRGEDNYLQLLLPQGV